MLDRIKAKIYLAGAYIWTRLEERAVKNSIRYLSEDNFAKSLDCIYRADKYREKYAAAYYKYTYYAYAK